MKVPRLNGFWRWLAALLLINFLVRLPLCWDPVNVDNDGAEYLAIARSLRTNGAYATDLKWHFYTDDPIQHPAWADRPPVYPAFAALCGLAMPFLPPTAAARIGNVFLACLALLLGAVYLRRLYNEKVALLAAGYVFLLPHMLYWTTQPMTEALSLLLGLAALLLWASTEDRIEPRRSPASAGTRDTEKYTERKEGREQQEAASHRSFTFHAPRSTLSVFGAGLLCGLSYLTRPIGFVFFVVFALDALRQHWQARREPDAPFAFPLSPFAFQLLWLSLGFLVCAVPYHLLLWRIYGSPFHSSLSFTFSVSTFYEVTYYGFERRHLTALEYLRRHGWELPGLILHQVWRHAQTLIPSLLGFLPLACWMRRPDWSGSRWVPGAVVAATVLVHTLTWAAWGSSRYFLLCLLLVAAALLAVGDRLRVQGSESSRQSAEGRRQKAEGKSPEPSALSSQLSAPTPQHPLTPSPPHPLGPRLAVLLPLASFVGLAIGVAQFYRTQARPDHGIPSLPAWRAAASEVRGSRVVASDKPNILNLLLEVPAVRLPRTTDPAVLARFIGKYHPDVLVLFEDEPAEAPMANAWRAGHLPPGWRLTTDTGVLLIARPGRPGRGAPSSGPG
jgi:hypothetical protein